MPRSLSIASAQAPLCGPRLEALFSSHAEPFSSMELFCGGICSLFVEILHFRSCKLPACLRRFRSRSAAVGEPAAKIGNCYSHRALLNGLAEGFGDTSRHVPQELLELRPERLDGVVDRKVCPPPESPLCRR